MTTNTSVYDAVLPILQDQSRYGGSVQSSAINLKILKMIDAGIATGDGDMIFLGGEIRDAANTVKRVQDYGKISGLIERYQEAAFFLVAKARGVALNVIPAGGKHGASGKSPDFKTASEPVVFLEMKTTDVADPSTTYGSIMREGLDATIAAHEEAKNTGLGFSYQILNVHGSAKDRRSVIEQVMRKIDGNVKQDQYTFGPTFLVVSTSRASLHDGPEGLKKRYTFHGLKTEASGHLFALAAHRVGEKFYALPEPEDIMTAPLIPNPDEDDVADLGVIDRNGILLDHPFIAGILFLRTVGSKWNDENPAASAHEIYGVWSNLWDETTTATREQIDAARAVFLSLCDAYNDTNDSNSTGLPNFP